MGEIVIVAYRPKPGQADALLALARTHVPELRGFGLATEREPVLVRAADGTLVEVFEWVDGGSEAAHTHPGVVAMWSKYAAVCDYVPVASLPEAQGMFATFSPVA